MSIQKLMINTYDECAIEAAVQLKKQGVAEEVVIFTVRKNEKSTKDQMITAMAKGADRAVVVDDADFNGAIA